MSALEIQDLPWGRLCTPATAALCALSFAASLVANNAAAATLLAAIDVDFDVCSTPNGGCVGWGPGNRENAPVSAVIGADAGDNEIEDWAIGPLTTEDVGRVFVANEGSAQDYLRLRFAGLVALMTNGPEAFPGESPGNGAWWFGINGMDYGTTESRLWSYGIEPNVLAQRFVKPFSPFDLFGYQIDRFEFVLHHLDVAYDEVRDYTWVAISYTIYIYGDAAPSTMLKALLTDVLGVGPGHSLADKIGMAQTYYAVPDIEATCAVLDDFTTQVDVLLRGKNPRGATEQLLAEAQAIQVAIGCD